VAEELGYPQDRIFVTYWGVREVFLQAKPEPSILSRLGLRKPYILFAGNREPRKNLSRLLAAFAEIPDREIYLVLAGPSGWGPGGLESEAQSLRVSERIVFPGYLSDEDLAAVMASSEAVVFPSIYEGFGLPALEACAVGVPIVAGRVGSINEILGDLPYWCDPLDVSSILGAIVKAIGDSGYDSARARAHASAFTWERSASATIEAYSRAVL